MYRKYLIKLGRILPLISIELRSLEKSLEFLLESVAVLALAGDVTGSPLDEGVFDEISF
jgi:hypothetical protein